MKDPRDFFPGDPPLGEWLVMLSAICSLVALLGFIAAVVRRGGSRYLGLASLALVLPSAWFLVARHSGPWRALQTELMTFEAEARDVLAGCNGNCDCAVQRLDEAHGTTIFHFTPEHRPVRLYLRCQPEQLVGVDFGSGANAVFDPEWMITVYSD